MRNFQKIYKDYLLNTNHEPTGEIQKHCLLHNIAIIYGTQINSNNNIHYSCGMIAPFHNHRLAFKRITAITHCSCKTEYKKKQKPF